MKKALLIFGLFAFAGVLTIQAQSNDNATQKVENAAMAAEKAAASDASIEKKVCETSGKVSYVRKNVCEKSGKVSYTSVSYDAMSGKFVSLEDAPKEGEKACDSKAKSASGCCASKGKASASADTDKAEAKDGAGCCASKGKASGVASKDGKACAKDGSKGAGCCSGKAKAKAATAEPALTPQG